MSRFTAPIAEQIWDMKYRFKAADGTPNDATKPLLEPVIKPLYGAFAALTRARAARQPLDLDLPERKIVLADDGTVHSVNFADRLDAHKLIEEFMVLANVAAAETLIAKRTPLLFRVHEEPPPEKLDSLRETADAAGFTLAKGQVLKTAHLNRLLNAAAGSEEAELINLATLRSMTQAYYSPDNFGHFGLALKSYAHFTSPIRRYADLLVHRALVDSYQLEQPKPKSDLPPASGLSDKDREDLGKIADAISKTERRAMEAERDTIDRYVAAWLSGRVGETFKTRITGVQSFGFFATIEGLGGDGLVPVSTLGSDYFRYDETAQSLVGERSGVSYTSGDRLELKLGEANALTGALKFVPLDADGSPIEARGNRPQYGGKGGGKGGKSKHKRKFMQGQRGRPGNIRHQGKKKR